MSTMDTLKNTGQICWKWTKRFFWLIIGLGICCLLFILFANYSEGTRTGYITKISHKGYVFKTYEGELNFGFFGGSANNGKAADNVWYFSVSDSDVAKQVEKASKAGQKVTLHYKQKYIKISFRGDTEYIVYKVESNPDMNKGPVIQQ